MTESSLPRIQRKLEALEASRRESAIHAAIVAGKVLPLPRPFGARRPPNPESAEIVPFPTRRTS